ncbi:hypothetical protein H7B90_00655 [Cohnella xylanilytica]|uniref:Uncharacterized protein n=1 Tax=Cohnella xylanilytica TaxID=557555 RepID=A0A841TV85_9BACL|nr:hypothetical protein [Cohnella xylanilytica]MBB6689901.1 hypothetical protein [Cohnella xylanilytica]
MNELNEVYLNMYRVAVQTGRLLISDVPVKYREELIKEQTGGDGNEPVTP